MARPDLNANLSSYDWFSILVLAKRRFSFRLLFLHVLMFVGAIAVLNFFAMSQLTVIERIFASALVAVPIVPLELWLSGTDKTVPVMPFYAFIYALMFGISTFLVDKLSTGIFGNPIGDRAIEAALELLLIGLLCLFAGYYSPLPSLIGTVAPRFSLSWSNPNVVRLSLWMMTVVGLIFALPNLPILPLAFAQLAGFGGDLFTLGVCGLLTLQLTVGLGTWQTIQLWAVFIPLRVLVGLASGLTGNGLLPALSLCIVYAGIRHVIPWKAIGLGTLAFFILRPVEGAFRIDNSPIGVVGGQSISEKIEHFADLTQAVIRFGAQDPKDVLQVSAHRLALTPTFAWIVRDTPTTVPYWDGTTYYPALFKLIPRFVFPDKPEELTGQEFGHRYGLIDLGNFDTSVNLPQIVELYANFGTIGVVLGMFLFGVIIRTVLNIYTHPGMGFGAVVASFYLASKLIDFQSAFSMVFGAVPWQLIFIAIVHLIVTSGEYDTSLILGKRPRPLN
jgi:hypothetical protein